MEPISFLKVLLKTIPNGFSKVLKIFGRKIVKINEYQEEAIEVDGSYPTTSLKCKEESNNGAVFYWSEIYRPDYERYYEIKDNTRRSFTNLRRILWIKRLK